MKHYKNRFQSGRALTLAGCLVAMTCAGVQPVVANGVPATAQPSQAQAGKTVKGVVVDQYGEPIIGANVVERGTQNGAITDVNGEFSLKLENPNAVLHVTFVGYGAADVPSDTKKIVLREDSELLDDVVVIGYGTQRKGDVTSSVASIKPKDFSGGQIGDATDLIKGKVAGLSITTSSGDPLQENSIMLRGIATVTGSVQPLVLVDGIAGSLSDVAPENIASIDVLKDGSAAAIYGTRGANGVILITTKSGHREESLQATYSTYAAFANWTKRADFMSASDIREGKTSFSDEGAETDWLDEVCNSFGFTQNHSLNLSGGSKHSAYSANISYTDENGIMKKSDNENLRLQLDLSHFVFKDKVKFNINALIREQNYTLNDNDYVYRQAIIRNPTAPVYNDDGSYNENFDKLYYYNPVEMQNEYEGDGRMRQMRLTGNITIEPIKGWKTNLMVSRDQYTRVTESYTSIDHYSLHDANKNAHLVEKKGKAGDVIYSYYSSYNGSASKSESGGRSDNLEFTSNYNKTIGKHRIDALVGYSYLYEVYDGFGASNGNFPTSAYKYNNLGAGTLIEEVERHASVSSNKEDETLIGFFSRVSYGFDDKYNLLVTFRREGSSKFGENNKWGNFPSVSAGWTLNKEEFMEDLDVLDNLKLRAGYGVTGVVPNESYLAQNVYNYDDWGDILSKDGTWVKTLQQIQNPNKDLKWETSREFNLGLDFGFFNNRLSGSIDFYSKKTEDLLYLYNVPVPPNLYPQTMANVGKMENKGIEIMVSGTPFKTRDFEWNTTVTLSHNANKLITLNNELYETASFVEVGRLGEPISTPTHCMEEGHRLGDFWGLKSVGVSKNGYTYVEVKDADGNWTVKEFDPSLNVQENCQRLGNGLPQVYMGWNHTFRYKGFDLAMQFTGQFGFDILNASRCFYECNSCAYNRLKSADKTYQAVRYNKETKQLEDCISSDGTPIMVKLSKNQSQGFWSDHIEKGDFVKLTNVTLGYTVPLTSAIKEYVTDARFYVACQNVFCITGYSGIDPEVDNYYQTPGIDYQDKYPTVRTFTVGMNLKF